MRAKAFAVVLGADAIGLGAARSLHAGGVPTIAVALKRWEPVRFSRCARSRLVPKSEDQDGAILDVLAGITGPEPPVLIPTSDFFAHFISRHRDELGTRFRSCVPRPELMELALDKARDTRVMAELGVPLPKTAASLPSTPAALMSQVGLPLIVKPRTYVDKRELGWRNVVIHDFGQLEQFYRTERAVFGRVIAQELIPGGDEALWEFMGVFDERSRLVSAFTFRKLRTMPAHYGQTSYGRSERNERTIETARRIGERLGYVGAADIDLKYDARDGLYKYLELNPRLGLCNHLATRCGVNLALDAWRVACGEEVPARPEQREGVTFLSALEDAGARLHDGESLPRILAGLLGALRRRPVVGAYFSWNDFWPGPLSAVRMVVRLFQRARRGELASVFTRDYGTVPAAAGVRSTAPPPSLAREHREAPAAPGVPGAA
jgi:predicted ATP-grasp superfamily ATP-dependent carboligase